MKNPSKLIFVASFVFFAILIKSTTAQEVEDEREFDYLQGSEKGPGHWGDLNKDWKACKNGSMQSPIDLSSKRVKVIPKLMDLKRNYKPCNATVKNRGHDISLKWEGDAGSIQINGTDYFLDQGHWHSPSEHSINGRRLSTQSHLRLSLFISQLSHIHSHKKPTTHTASRPGSAPLIFLTSPSHDSHRLYPRRRRTGSLLSQLRFVLAVADLALSHRRHSPLPFSSSSPMATSVTRPHSTSFSIFFLFFFSGFFASII